jgi:hypothetical protein
MAADPRPSVFGYVDQDEVIKRIDDVQEDDLTSGFFGDSIQDVENAATDIFDIGVRDEVETDGLSASHPFAVPTDAGHSEPAPSALPTTAPAPTNLDKDARARQAFILGGPDAMKRD